MTKFKNFIYLVFGDLFSSQKNIKPMRVVVGRLGFNSFVVSDQKIYSVSIHRFHA